MSDLGNNVKSLRTKKGWSLVALSHKTGIPVSTLHGIEKGSKPSFEKINKLANAFGVNISELFEPNISIKFPNNKIIENPKIEDINNPIIKESAKKIDNYIDEMTSKSKQAFKEYLNYTFNPKTLEKLSENDIEVLYQYTTSFIQTTFQNQNK